LNLNPLYAKLGQAIWEAIMSWKKIVPAERTKHIKYAIRDIVVLAKEVEKSGKEMLYLNIGDPNIYDFVTPKQVIDDTVNAMRNNQNGYAPSNGIDDAVNAIRIDAEKKGFKNIEDIFITTGASEAIDIALTALLNTGDNFLLPAPTYPLYDAIINKLAAEPRHYFLDEENNWEPDLKDLESKIDENTKGILIINPNNPTGTNYSEKSLKSVIEIAKKHGLLLFSDEIYDKLLFSSEDKHISMASIDNEAPIVTFNGLSKSHIVPGFRIGWGILTGKKELVSEYNEGMQKFVRARLSANKPEQFAIKNALLTSQPHIKEMTDKLKQRGDLTYKRMNAIDGLSLVKPQGAFYAFVKIDLDIDDFTFCKRLIEEYGVVTVHGSGFGQKPDTKHFRIVFLPNEEILNKAYDKIEEFVKKLRMEGK
jgi:alanine-synthesizing transaminase